MNFSALGWWQPFLYAEAEQGGLVCLCRAHTAGTSLLAESGEPLVSPSLPLASIPVERPTSSRSRGGARRPAPACCGWRGPAAYGPASVRDVPGPLKEGYKCPEVTCYLVGLTCFCSINSCQRALETFMVRSHLSGLISHLKLTIKTLDYKFMQWIVTRQECERETWWHKITCRLIHSLTHLVHSARRPSR